ncbi:MAG: ABC transporter ATP-binding protein [Desulfobacterales bacterium]|nr:ABC transporter ATP-binding protein [Desulfobacterales bacterium]MDD4073300.1 ABC transporter ATP-binding protein [Desulfobacterales bacterium]MDD4393505.1 ABC transporter ATP-binding protein [Desulfobacterales bacterium]
MTAIAISVRNLSKCYPVYANSIDRFKEALDPLRRCYHHPFHALKNVTFDVEKGSTYGIIGRNGSGKSTLLKLIAGILTSTEGSVFTDGKILALLELGAGFNPELSGIENVYFYGTLLGSSKNDMKQRLSDILEFADIGDFACQPMKTYSSGMYVRLAFAVIANMDADILIIDEALAVGDAFFVQKCMRFLRRFREHGTIVFVSHDTAAVKNLCNHALWIDNGQMRMQGDAKSVCENYLAAVYEQQQGQGLIEPVIASSDDSERVKKRRDQRQNMINGSHLRNDIEIFEFDPNAPSFGIGIGRITHVDLQDEEGISLSWVVGGETVVLSIRTASRIPLKQPIIGFYIKDRLGQTLFGDNTYLTTLHQSITSDRFEARFVFCMPILPAGEYSICAALAEGSQQDHVQHHWVHDALIFQSHSSSVTTGLIGIPMTKIELRSISCD